MPRESFHPLLPKPTVLERVAAAAAAESLPPPGRTECPPIFPYCPILPDALRAYRDTPDAVGQADGRITGSPGDASIVFHGAEPPAAADSPGLPPPTGVVPLPGDVTGVPPPVEQTFYVVSDVWTGRAIHCCASADQAERSEFLETLRSQGFDEESDQSTVCEEQFRAWPESGWPHHLSFEEAFDWIGRQRVADTAPEVDLSAYRPADAGSDLPQRP